MAAAGRDGTAGASRWPSWLPLEERVAWRPLEARAGRAAPERPREPSLGAARSSSSTSSGWSGSRTSSRPRPWRTARARCSTSARPRWRTTSRSHVAGIATPGPTRSCSGPSRGGRGPSPGSAGLVTAIAARYAAQGRALRRARRRPDLPVLRHADALCDGTPRIGRGARDRRGHRGRGARGRVAPGAATARRRLGRPGPAVGHPHDARGGGADGLPGSGVRPGRRCSEVLGTSSTARGGRADLVGPEWPWVAAELLAFGTWSRRPFRERFRWPHVPPWMTTGASGCPRYEAYLRRRAPVRGACPASPARPWRSRSWTWPTSAPGTRDHGQAAGDELLALLTSLLRAIPESRTIRDGGDEFLVIGSPAGHGPRGAAAGRVRPVGRGVGER